MCMDRQTHTSGVLLQRLCGESQALHHAPGQRVSGVDDRELQSAAATATAIAVLRLCTGVCICLFLGEVAQQRQSADAEEGVEDVHHVARAVCNASPAQREARHAVAVHTLALQDEGRQLVLVDPRYLLT